LAASNLRPVRVSRLRTAVGALATIARNPALLRAQLSFAAGWTSEWALVVAVGVVAYQAGGAVQVSLIASLRMALPALVAPFLSVLVDRFRRDRILLWSGLLRGAAIAAAAALIATGGPLLAIYALVVLAACAFIVIRAGNSALIPLLCRSPLELTSAMASRGLLDSVSTLVGPLLAALVLTRSSPAAVLAIVAALSVASSLLLVSLRYETPSRPPAGRAPNRLVADTVEGLAALFRYRDAGVLVGLALVQTFTRGCLTVFLVVLAFDVLGAGQSGFGVLTAAVGAGATVGSVAAFSLLGSRHLALLEGIGVALWGLPLVLSAATGSRPVVVLLMAAIGVGNALVDLGLFTLVARLVPEALLGRVFGTFESLIALTVAAGALLTPLAISGLGLTRALALLGSIAPAAALIAVVPLLKIDRAIVHRDAEIGVLRRVPMLQALPMPVIESLAEKVGHAQVAAGLDAIRQGEAGDTFYVIAAGRASVIRDGELLAKLAEGDCFGEIALLRDSPRTATVRADTDLSLYVLGRLEFLSALRGCSAGDREAQSLVRERVGMFKRAEPAVAA
jgi:MFS family permease